MEELNFFDALKEVSCGKRITKREWNDQEIYLTMADGRLKISKQGKLHDLIISDGDMTGEDWVVIYMN